MYCYSLVREFFDFLHGDWGDLNLNYLRVGINDIFAVQQLWTNLNFLGVEEEDVPRCQFHISFKVNQTCARKTKFVNNGETNSSTDRNDKLLKKIQPPPVAELIFTADDVWSASRLSQTGLQVYSVNGIDRNFPGKHKDHRDWANYSVISFSPRSRTKSPHAYGGDVQQMRKAITTRRSLTWQERSKKHWVIKSTCKCCHPSSTRSYFTTFQVTC